MPPIEGFANIVTVCLGRNIRFNIIIQSYSQLKKIYGDDQNTIIDNCGNQIYILTSDYDTAHRISNNLGFKTLVNDSLSGRSFSFYKSTTESLDKRELKTPTELMSLEEGEDIVIRVIKRQDRKRNRIKSKPIFNTGETKLKYRYEYLQNDFDTSKSLDDLKFESLHKDIDLRKLVLFNDGNNESKEQRETQETQETPNSKKITVDNKEMPKQYKIQIQGILRKYDDLKDVNIQRSNVAEIQEILLEHDGLIETEDKFLIQNLIDKTNDNEKEEGGTN